jgi:hypothetical protein
LQHTHNTTKLFAHRGHAGNIGTNGLRNGEGATVILGVRDAEASGNALLHTTHFRIGQIEGLQRENGLTIGIDRIERHWGLPLSFGARSTLSSDYQFAFRFLRRSASWPGDG